MTRLADQPMSSNGHDKTAETPTEWTGGDPWMHFDLTLSRQEEYFAAGVAKYGGGFARSLAALYRRADHKNRRIIRESWPIMWVKYVKWGFDEDNRSLNGT